MCIYIYILYINVNFACWVFFCLSSNILPTNRLVTMNSWRFYSVAPLGNQATGTITQYSTQSWYPASELTSPCPIKAPY